MSNEPKNTHIATTPNKRPLTPFENLKKEMAGELMKQVKNYYAGNKDEAMRFMTSAVEYVRRTPKLLECDKPSLMMAFLQSAQFRFLPSGVSGEAYVIPYGSQAKFQIGYQGVITLLYRTERVSTINAQIIYQNDEFEYLEGLDPKLIHKPAMFGKPRGEAIGVYAVAQMKDGGKIFKVMDKNAVMAIKNLSKAKNVKDSPWNSDRDPEKWMWKKSCLLQLSKLLPKTPDLQKAIEKDMDGEGIEKADLDAGGLAVGGSYHNPKDLEAEEANVKDKPAGQDQDDDIPIINEEN
jgi:recombination protein RecT